MCGIAGLVRMGQGHGALADIARAMGDAVRHRGPDDGREWLDSEHGVALAHRRLAIIDLSAAGAQPMVSASGRYAMVFNGEIYDHLELRDALAAEAKAPAWRGHSDTESLLAAIEAWGLPQALQRASGMFAFALWDRHARNLQLVRDRMGEKPLYYGWAGRDFVFASELKALRAHPAFQGGIDRGSLCLLMRHNYIAGPRSIYQDVRKLQPGAILRLYGGNRPGDLPQPVPYWSLAQAIEQGRASPWQGAPAEAIDGLDRLLRGAVGRQMVADVPLGAFLSGGIDSSTVAALMQAQSSRPVKTFTIGFREPGYDEAGHALAVARHLGTEHTDLYVTPQDAIDVIPGLPKVYDEPFADPSQIPTWLVAQLARRHVTVSLSGDGGDELFGGYERYFLAQALWQRLQRVPEHLRAALARAVLALPVATLNRLFGLAGPLLPARARRYQNPGDKLHKLAQLLASMRPETVYRQLVSHWDAPDRLVLGGAQEPPTPLVGPMPAAGSFIESMMALDSLSYLPDDILVKVDRAAMAHGLETRVPLLDHRVVEFAWRLPVSMKARPGHGKWVLRQVLARYVPERITDRPKMGFGVPIDAWLRGPLRPWAEALIDPVRLRREGFFDADAVHAKWREHLSGQRDWHYRLWNVLMFQAWWEHQRCQAGGLV
ncbi:asparagine synthetase B [Pseudorhodoferax aquiterrae]|uniref:asparagine synthase (glutamine-hydrolyzing) n=1 Tax=Pseudorhodoferax aquiterrae TaxID=747304 RepID=A0ABQ3GAP3_9BURK|nr:asparagine synthase (glutamine-hydrolyzing) [Pseudorhodoferax aquiterrae]GHC99656.1 asparagine synthetase B [Pseudorhodoferax aquiterrae]